MLRKLFVIPALISASVAGAIGPVSQAQAQAEPYIGQSLIFAGNFCPLGWEEARGQLLSIAEYEVLYTLIGTTYGGDGQTTFGVPDLRGRLPIGDGTGPSGLPTHVMGEQAGTTSFTLNTTQMPSHTHAVKATNVLADKTGPATKYIGLSVDNQFHNGPPNTTMAPDMITPTGGNQPVDHRGPYLGMKICIAVFGVFPSQP